jgi:uncharacterized protein YbdZ (MbtH family)
MTVNLEDYKNQADCVYKDERYSARDNGAVLRHSPNGNRHRPTDNKWTFGKPNTKTGYMEIASVRVHRIIAFAFHGEPPTKEHVIDHIDTNKRNNRPENLRWVTRLENVLLNPITVKRIELACKCSVEEFLEDPSKFRNKFQEPNYEWMCTVTAEEGQTSLKRMKLWAASDKLPSGGSLGEWIYNREFSNQHFEAVSDLTPSLTSNAIQQNWKTPSEFPYSPQAGADNSVIVYATNLKAGQIFSRNQYSSSIVTELATSKDGNTLWVLTKNSQSDAIKPWSLAQVTFENNLFVHSNLGSFFEKVGADKYFTLAQGLEWTGGDTFDDLT